MESARREDDRQRTRPPFSPRVPLIVAAAFFMEMLDGTIIATALPSMAQDLRIPALTLADTITVYLVAVTVFLPVAAWASDRFGARNVFAAAIACFTFASVICGISRTLTSLLTARAIQGSAAAFMSPVGRLIVLREAPKERLIDAIGLIVWPALVAPVIGPPLGGLIATYASWRWIFLLNLPLGILGIYLVLRFVPAQRSSKQVRFDAVGFVLTSASLATLIYGLTLFSQGGTPTVAGGVFVALALASGSAAMYHARVHPKPVLDLAAARITTFTLSTLSAGLLARIAINMTPFLLPLMFQIGLGASAVEAGFMLLVYMAGNLAMKSVTTPILRRFDFRRVILVNGGLCAATIVACAFLSRDLPLLIICAVLFFAGATRSMNFTSTNTLAFADVPEPLRASASTLAAIAQQAAAAMSVAAATLSLGLSQLQRGASEIVLDDFRRALLVAGCLMALSVIWSSRLDQHAGSGLSARQAR